MARPRGWVKEPVRHGLAAKGVKTSGYQSRRHISISDIGGKRATPSQAKKVVMQWLVEKDIPFTKLRARTVHFTDLARDSMVFVKIFGWEPNPAIEELEGIAKEKGFRVETDWMFG